MATPASGVNTWLTLNGHPLSFQPEDDNSEVQAKEYPPNTIRITPRAPDDLEIWIDGEKLETERYGSWLWRPRSFAGIYELSIKASGGRSYPATVRVLHSRLSFDRYEQMLSDIREISEDLVVQLHSPAHERARMRTGDRSHSALRDYQLIKAIWPDLTRAMAQIRLGPHYQLSGHSETVLAHQVRRFSGEAQPVPGPMMQLVGETGTRYFPQLWDVQENVLTYDSYENRLLKSFLWRQLQPKLMDIQEKASQEIVRRERARQDKLRQGWTDDETTRINPLKGVVEDCQEMLNQCIAWGSEPFLRHVKLIALAQEPTQVLQKHPDYNRFYRVYLRCQTALGINLNAERYLARLAMRKLSELYETWSVFTATNMLIGLLIRAGYKLITSHDFFEVTRDQFQIDVDRNASIMLSKGSHRVVIRYEPLYPSTSSLPRGMVANSPTQRTPDLGIEVWDGGEVISAIIFDAKYRSQSTGTGETYLEEDLAKMNDYLWVIRWKSNKLGTRPRQVVTSAYILYPGNVLEHNPKTPESGALPLVPGMPQVKEVASALHQILKNADLL